jgi:hypothetical protein
MRFCLSAPLLALVLATSAWPALAADWVLIANARSGLTRLTQEEVTHIFLGRYRRLSTGATAEPVDQAPDSALKAIFYRQLVGKNLAEINAYWARLVFSGKTQPPRSVASSDDALRYVMHHPAALAYVERSKVDGRVLVVFEMEN